MAADKAPETVAKQGLMQRRIRAETQLCLQNSNIKPQTQLPPLLRSLHPSFLLSIHLYLSVNDECLISVGTELSLGF